MSEEVKAENKKNQRDALPNLSAGGKGDDSSRSCYCPSTYHWVAAVSTWACDWIGNFVAWWTYNRVLNLLTLAIFLATVVYVHFANLQWTEMHQQNINLGRQIDDAEAIARANIVFFNTRVEGFPEHPIVKFTLKNVGQTTATEITAGPIAGSSGPVKAFKSNPLAMMGPGEHSNLDLFLRYNPPSVAGFSLAQSQSRDFVLPLKDFGLEESKTRPKTAPIMPTFADIRLGRGSFFFQMFFTYLDAKGAPPSKFGLSCLFRWWLRPLLGRPRAALKQQHTRTRIGVVAIYPAVRYPPTLR